MKYEFKENECPVCLFNADVIPYDFKRKATVVCPMCGNYVITSLVFEFTQIATLKNARVILSYWIRKHQYDGIDIILDWQEVKEIIENEKLPDLNDQINNFILLIGDNSSPGKDYTKGMNVVANIIGAEDWEGVFYIANHLNKKGLINTSLDNSREFHGHLTPEGWEKYYSLNKIINKYKIAFMAMQYNDDLLNSIYNNHFKPTLKSLEIELVTLDERLKAGILDNQLRNEIKNSHLLLVDLSHGNQGAYWEAGYAEGIGKPVIYLCKRDVFKDKKTHFDTNHMTTITWELETIEDDMKKLKAAIRTTFPAEAKMED